MSLLQGVRLYPKAIAWSILISTCIAMEGYQVALVNNFYGFAPFNAKYGEPTGDPEDPFQVCGPGLITYRTLLIYMHRFQLHGKQVSRMVLSLANSSDCSSMDGHLSALGTARLSSSALRLSLRISSSFSSRPISRFCSWEKFCVVSACSKRSWSDELLIYCIGMPWGVFQTLTITYASEVCPIALRGYLTTYVNCCWGLGQLIAIGVIRSMFTRTDEWAYRIPYALQWMWPVPLVIGVAFAPESPWSVVVHQFSTFPVADMWK